MNKTIFLVTVVVAVIALAMIMSTIIMSDVLADSKRDRANKVLDKHISARGNMKTRHLRLRINSMVAVEAVTTRLIISDTQPNEKWWEPNPPFLDIVLLLWLL